MAYDVNAILNQRHVQEAKATALQEMNEQIAESISSQLKAGEHCKSYFKEVISNAASYEVKLEQLKQTFPNRLDEVSKLETDLKQLITKTQNYLNAFSQRTDLFSQRKENAKSKKELMDKLDAPERVSKLKDELNAYQQINNNFQDELDACQQNCVNCSRKMDEVAQIIDEFP